MASKKVQDARAARERKQKIVLAVGGVVLLALGVIQGPKLLGGSSSGTATTATAGATAGSTSAAGTPATGTPAAVTPSGPTSVGAAPSASRLPAPKTATAQLAGIVIVPEQPVRAGTGQLQSLSRFDGKDPFKQQVSDQVKLPTPAQVAGLPPNPVTKPGTRGSTAAGVPNAPGATGGTAVPGTAPAPAVPPTMALFKINGKLVTVDLKARFPKSDKAFVLRSLKLSPGRATIGVAGGSFAGHQSSLTLSSGHGVTLINTATGVRYVIKLLFVGSDPDQVAAFSAR